jgi:hypothetical protein
MTMPREEGTRPLADPRASSRLSGAHCRLYCRPLVTLQGRDGDGVLEAGQGGLAGQVVVLGGAVGQELEDGVGAQGVVVILVLVAGQDAVHAGSDHLQERVLGEVRGTVIVQGLGESPGQPDALIELADREEPGVAGELAR